MAKFEDHMAECKKYITPWDEETEALAGHINRFIDQFAHFPNGKFCLDHRKFLHHKEGVAWFGKAFGPLGKKIAELHVMLDCAGQIPDAKEFYDGKLDEFGLKWY